MVLPLGDRPPKKHMTQTNYRRCVACRKLAPKQSFWRVVRVYPSQTVQLDRGMGRSAYLCPNRDCLTLAQRKQRLRRSLKKNIPTEIYQQLALRLN
ncbi:YlxR family protein [[Limnothrix rosea] IAM M-220]|uniref:YlxR family protein n=1 Tax=[Limnothrix rosea] IAM M-220 TaxID=454133 RepID=UPI001CECBE96|nr:YlxR family protein [[Limnothrix rosea] IAM M-220]